MKTIGLTIILCVSILVLLLLLVPVGVTIELRAYPDQRITVNGQLRVAQITVTNNGWFTQRIQLPELTACIGEEEVPLDAWLATDSNLVPGVGQKESITLRAGESGKIYLIAREGELLETMRVYHRVPYFSCLNPGQPIN